MVRSMKEGMEAIGYGRKLTDEILLTVLVEIDSFFNARYAARTREVREAKSKTPKNADRSWNRRQKEYFPTINKRSKWLADTKPVKVADVVYLTERNRRTGYDGD